MDKTMDKIIADIFSKLNTKDMEKNLEQFLKIDPVKMYLKNV